MPVTNINRIAADLAAATLTDVTAGGLAANKGGTYIAKFVNRGLYGAHIRLAVTGSGGVAGGAPVNADYVVFDRVLDSSAEFVAKPIPLADGMRVYALADVAGVSVTLIGRVGG
ncbi:MAG: hypothetical protein ACOYOJ_19300 [Alsobacter sp.]